MSEKTKELAVQGAKMELNIDTNEVTIKNLIYVIRGQQVLLDSDLAMLYQVETKNLNKAVKRNANRFPEDFCFQLSEEEYDSLRFQFGTSSLSINCKYNMLTRVVGGRALIQSELCGKDDAYEYIRGIYRNLNRSVIDCSNSGYEKS